MSDKNTPPEGGLLKDERTPEQEEAAREAARRRAEARKRKKQEEEMRLIQERRELLKLKQGIIEESELVPQTGYEAASPTELHGAKKLENFWYHHKWKVIVGVLVCAMLGFLIGQSVTKVHNDLYVLMITTNSNTYSAGLARQHEIENAIADYCANYDKNSYVHVGVNVLYLPIDGTQSQFTDMENFKFTSEMITGDSQIWICDEGMADIMERALSTEDEKLQENKVTLDDVEFFLDLSGEYPEAEFNKYGGLVVNKTALMDTMRWDGCPDDVVLYVRREFTTEMTGNDTDAKEQRKRAEEVLRNIIEENAVSADVKKK